MNQSDEGVEKQDIIVIIKVGRPSTKLLFESPAVPFETNRSRFLAGVKYGRNFVCSLSSVDCAYVPLKSCFADLFDFIVILGYGNDLWCWEGELPDFVTDFFGQLSEISEGGFVCAGTGDDLSGRRGLSIYFTFGNCFLQTKYRISISGRASWNWNFNTDVG